MKSIMDRKMTRWVTGFLLPALCISMLCAPALAQPPRRPGGYPGRYVPPPSYRRASDFDRTLAVIGTVGAVATAAAIANSRNNSYYYPRSHYYRSPYYRSPVVVAPQRPVVVERQVIVEQPVIVERQVPIVVGSDGAYSPKLKASFHIENMQIPGYRFTGARLMSDPSLDSPLNGIGLRQGDVITRLGNSPVDTLAELEQHDRNTQIRYIKAGTTKVLIGSIYIPAGRVRNNEIRYAP
jgi:hypothetical protein